MKRVMTVITLMSTVALGAITASWLHAQPVASIILDADELQQLGIRFAPVTALDANDGDRVLATVINSPEEAAVMTLRFGGVLQRWHVGPGDQVESGTLLATMVSDELLQAQQSWLQAALADDAAQTALQRDQQLYNSGIIAAARLQTSRNNADQARVIEQSTRQRLLQSGVTTTELSQWRQQLPDPGIYQVRATRTGHVGRREASVGEFVASGSAILEMHPDDNPWLQANIPLRQATALSRGQHLSLARSGDAVAVVHIDHHVDTRTQSIEVIARFTTSVSLLPGQLVALLLPPPPVGVRVPAEAVVRSGEQATVFVRNTQGVEARSLILQPVGRHYAAGAGLAVGEEVVVQGTALLRGIQLGLGGEE